MNRLKIRLILVVLAMIALNIAKSSYAGEGGGSSGGKGSEPDTFLILK